jgi:predicted NUDIX family phosphoesterase
MTSKLSNSQFLIAAQKALTEAGRPLSTSEIVHHALGRGFLTTNGHTPTKTMNARLSADILLHKAQSRFMRTGPGRFALRDWDQEVSETIVPRRQLALIDEYILAFDASLLRKFASQEGLSRNENTHHELLSSCFAIKRSEAETRFDIIQLISVYVVRFVRDVLSYKRTKRLPEGRLHDKYSCFFGGHLNEADLMPLFRFSDPEQALYLLDRELSEELRLERKPKEMRFKGLLYDPRTEVSKQHIGVVFCVDLEAPEFEIGERGFLTDAKFETVAQMRARIREFENWSEFLIEHEIGGWN